MPGHHAVRLALTLCLGCNTTGVSIVDASQESKTGSQNDMLGGIQTASRLSAVEVHARPVCRTEADPCAPLVKPPFKCLQSHTTQRFSRPGCDTLRRPAPWLLKVKGLRAQGRSPVGSAGGVVPHAADKCGACPVMGTGHTRGSCLIPWFGSRRWRGPTVVVYRWRVLSGWLG